MLNKAPRLAAGYDDDHAADTDCPERELWRATLRQVGHDLFDSNERIRADAIAFFESPDLLLIMDLAGIASDLAPWLRRRALELVEASLEQRQPTGKRISYQGQTRSLKGWSEATGISIFTLSHRLRRGWSIARALSTPGRH